MRCFLSYSYKTDISVIKKILSVNNIFYINPTESLEYGASFLQVIKRQIKDSDFVIAVFDQSTNVSFEIGLAMGSKKPVFAIVPEQAKKDLPLFLSAVTYTLAKPTDYDKIKFSFDLFIKKFPTIEKVANMPPPPKEKKHKDKLTFDFVNSLHNISTLKGQEFENFVGELFKKINIDILAQNKLKEKDFQADFSLWIDKVNSSVGNPIIVETKSFANHHNLKEAVEQLSSYLKKYNSKAGLLIYNKPDGESYNDLYYYSPLLISISIQDLIHKLTEKTFSDILIELRNKAAHKEIY